VSALAEAAGAGFRAFEAAGLWCLRARAFEALPRVNHAFTTARHAGGDVDPLSDPALRERALRALGFDPASVVDARQVHGDTVVEAAAVHRGARIAEADAIVTADAGVTLSVRAADCLPILLIDSHAGVCGAVHAGWRGLAREVILAAVTAACRLGARPERIAAAVGPAISAPRYEVDTPVVDALGVWAGAPDALTPRTGRPGRWTLDLRAVAVAQFAAAGIPRPRVAVCAACTASHPEWFFSYRRDGRTGRMEGWIQCPPS
jgi:YfiH family protein